MKLKSNPILLGFALATLFLAAILSLAYYKVVLDIDIDPQSYATSLDLHSADAAHMSSGGDWIKRLKDATKMDYSYPVSEIEIALQEEKPGFDKRFYRVVIDELDGYKFFCVNQVLSANNINYSFYKDGGLVRLVIATTDYKDLKEIMDTIKTYGIDYKIEE